MTNEYLEFVNQVRFELTPILHEIEQDYYLDKADEYIALHDWVNAQRILNKYNTLCGVKEIKPMV